MLPVTELGIGVSHTLALVCRDLNAVVIQLDISLSV
jgi:hypothetical protein